MLGFEKKALFSLKNASLRPTFCCISCSQFLSVELCGDSNDLLVKLKSRYDFEPFSVLMSVLMQKFLV